LKYQEHGIGLSHQKGSLIGDSLNLVLSGKPGEVRELGEEMSGI